MNKHITIPISYELSTMTKINPVISRYVVRVMYPEGNRNGSYFSKQTIEKMVETIGGIPVIGQYDEKAEDFMAHGDLVFRTNADGTSEVALEGTEPYGFVNLKPNYWWAPHEDKDGVTREYLHVEVFLWTGRYKELERLQYGKNNHSMEIEASGNWGEVDGQEYFICDENSYFTGLCILGEAVEPCFEGSAIIPAFSLLKQERLEELNFALQNFEEEPDVQPNQDPEGEPTEPTEPTIEPNIEEPTPEEKVEISKEEYDRLKDIETSYQRTVEDNSEKDNMIAALENDVNTFKNNINELESKVAALEEENTNLKNSNATYEKEIEKTQKLQLVNEYKDKLSAEDYNLLLKDIDNMEMDKLKTTTLEFSVKYLSNIKLFNNKEDISTLNPQDSSSIELYDKDSWEYQVYKKQQEEK